MPMSCFELHPCQKLSNANVQYLLQRKALEETNAMFPQLKQKIEDAKAKLEAQLVSISIL